MDDIGKLMELFFVKRLSPILSKPFDIYKVTKKWREIDGDDHGGEGIGKGIG